ncbi:transmembrane protein 145 [Plakobranchus ocellatus]|uniref:Transmembrane protein 145 n=1 Tax=Plakobranchus ocellatus TaxID=259542 RepID=A0AAV4C106_9GAST|nr:transmembrane protein 145 [Plakobranchus ocellatus]
MRECGTGQAGRFRCWHTGISFLSVFTELVLEVAVTVRPQAMEGQGSSQGHKGILMSLTFLLLASAGQHKVRAQEIRSDSAQNVCTVKGRVYTNRDWYGYLVHKGFQREYAKIQYQITYPMKECCASLLIYYDDQVKQLRSSMTCQERRGILPPDNNQVIPLRGSNDTTSGCSLWNETGEPFFVCLGERVFRSSIPRTWFFAVSRCDSSAGPLNLNYVFNITGYYGECEDDPLTPSSGWNSYVRHLNGDEDSSSMKSVYLYLSISLGIVAGIALILAAVFFGLWFVGVKSAGKGKGGSVTSSQATMTQDDIFYVNPSLSDRGEHPEYNQTNSGSENYYEVIPERRSYESINAGLSSNSSTLMSANGGLHLRHIRSGGGGGSLNHHHHPMHIGMLHHHGHHPQHHLHPNGAIAGHLSLNQHNPHRPHPLMNGHAPQAQMNNVLTGGAGIQHKPNGLPYVFEDYPPPPYQPPRVLGIKGGNSGPTGGLGAATSSASNLPDQSNITPSSGNGHSHTLSLPTSQRRQPLCHHAYHSSLVPTSEALGSLGNNNNGMSSSMILNSGNNVTISSSGMLINNNNLGGGMEGIQAPPTLPISSSAGGPSTSLGTFGGGPNSSNASLSPSGAGINLSSLANHQFMNGATHSFPNSTGGATSNAPGSTPLSSLATALSLNPPSSSNHVPAPAPGGLSETSA